MIALKLSSAALWMNAKLFGEDQSFQGICTDSRAVQPGNIFVAIKGEKVDGHQFLREVQAHGAVAAIVDHVQENISLPQLKVDNTVLALGRLAQKYRESFPIPLAAVTGSCGKTTVKEMLASILSIGGPLLASQGNLNTEVGLPLTLLRLSAEKRCGVVEMGARQKGDIRYLMSLANPDVTTITNAGVAHMEIFGSERGIAEAKGEIFSQLKPNGTAVINVDDQYADYWKSLIKTQKILTFGLKTSEQTQPDFRVKNLQETSEGCEFELITPKGNRKVFLKAFGKHSVSNALAATAMAYALGIPMDEMVMGLEKFTPVSGRLQIKQGIFGSKILDDTYNANPVSVKAALAVLANRNSNSNSNSNNGDNNHADSNSQKNPEKTLFVMGDMLELGNNELQQHREMGEEAHRLGIHKMYGIGPLTREAIKAFGTSAQHFADKTSLIQALIQELQTQEKDLNNYRILIKGSRGMRMEEIVQALMNSETLGSSREKNPC